MSKGSESKENNRADVIMTAQDVSINLSDEGIVVNEMKTPQQTVSANNQFVTPGSGNP
jgi:hypothetical protein